MYIQEVCDNVSSSADYDKDRPLDELTGVSSAGMGEHMRGDMGTHTGNDMGGNMGVDTYVPLAFSGLCRLWLDRDVSDYYSPEYRKANLDLYRYVIFIYIYIYICMYVCIYILLLVLQSLLFL